MNSTEETINLFNQYVIGCYTRNPVVITRGKGSWVWDSNGKKYLDLFPGWGVNGLGHCHPNIVKAVTKQVKQLIHVPNNYYNEPQGILAKLLIENSFPGKCFFCNSGAEANEGAMKLARKYGNQNGKYEIITALGSFHGRTMACITATGQKKYRKGLEPLIPGFKYVPFGDIDALTKTITTKTAAILIEPIQGEGGINIANKEYIQKIRTICNEQDILFILDEVQTGMGRTGKMFAYEHFGIEPDVITLAKALGGGLAIGALIVKERFSGILHPGSHASTFGGNPIACAAAIAVIETIKNDNLLEKIKVLEKYLQELLNILKNSFPGTIKQIRGMGLMWGVELNRSGKEIVKECMNKGLLINCTQDNILRLLPAMITNKKELALGTKILTQILRGYAGLSSTYS